MGLQRVGHDWVTFAFTFTFMPSFGGLPGGISGKEPACQCRRHRDVGSIPGSGRSPGYYSHSSIILAWRIPWTEEPGGLVHGVAKSLTNWAHMHHSFLADVTLYDLHIRGWTISGHLNHVLSFPPLSTTMSWINYSSYIQIITISLLPMQMYFQHVIHMVKEVLTLKTSEFLIKNI